MAYRDDDYDDEDEGPGFLGTFMLLSLLAGGGYLVWRTLSAGTAAPTDDTGLAPATDLTTSTPAPSLLSNLVTAAEGATGLLPVGIRNNNPGNLKYNPANAWTGQTGQDSNGFAVFSDPVYGLRAAFRVLQSYSAQMPSYGTFDIISISANWTMTDRTSWAANVSSVAGIAQETKLDVNNQAQMTAVMNGIVVAENGQSYNGYYAGVLDQAFQMAATA